MNDASHDDHAPSRTCDTISDRLELWQSRKGYRFGLDALLLATDLPHRRDGSLGVVIDLGAGNGAVGLSIAARHEASRVLLVERNPSMLALLEYNIEANAARFAPCEVQLVPLDLRQFRDGLTSHQADLVVSNPPYFPLGHRRQSELEERADAHHERHGDLNDFVAAAAYALSHRGWFKVILPPWRLPELIAALQGRDLKLLSLRFVHAEPGASAYLMEALMRRGGGPELEVRPPLHVRGEDGFYTEEVARRVAGAADASPSAELLARTRDSSDKKRGI